ncbi:MAG: DUF2238 domain-containing protein [Nitrosospira sp.]|nr:DUF2238 domain-containing protein [Nitrosospira sp.]
MNEKPFRERRLLQALCICYTIIWILTAIEPVKRNDWLLENLLVFTSVPALVFTYQRLPLSDISYVLIFLFLVMHAVGAHYTYAEVPLGYWLKDLLQLERNHFDRIVHFWFGVMAYPVQEVVVRGMRVANFWALVLPASIIVALSGFFEIIEAVIAMLVDPELGTAYLGTQGDVWDAQKDMALAIVGAALAVSIGRRNVRMWNKRRKNEKTGPRG